MKDTITSHKFYAVWEYKREEKDLNEASKNGLQLVKGGCFHSVFRKDDRVRYILNGRIVKFPLLIFHFRG